LHPKDNCRKIDVSGLKAGENALGRGRDLGPLPGKGKHKRVHLALSDQETQGPMKADGIKSRQSFKFTVLIISV